MTVRISYDDVASATQGLEGLGACADLRGARVGVLISGGNIDLSRFAQLMAA